MGTFKFTYDHDPGATDRDAVRWHVGDTDERRPLLDDREIDFALAAQPEVVLAAADCATALAGKFSSKSSITVGPISKQMGDIAQKFRDHAEELRSRAGVLAGVSFPAIAESTKQPLETDTDLITPQLTVGLGDNPFAIQLNGDLTKVGFNGR